MDGDDISHPIRFEKQIEYLKGSSSVDLVGTSMQRFNDKGIQDILYSIEKPNKFTLKNRSPFNHATIMTYKRVFELLEGYTVSERTNRSQDYNLWFRFFKKNLKGRNIITPLYYVREDSSAIRRRTFRVRFNSFKTTLVGFKILNFPIHWCFVPTIKFVIKALTPHFMVDMYRIYQEKRAKKHK